MTNPFEQQSMASHNNNNPGTVSRKPPVTSSFNNNEPSEDTYKKLKRKIKEITEVYKRNLGKTR